MVTILAAAAVALFAILIAICLFGFFLYHQETWKKRHEKYKNQSGYVGTVNSYTSQPYAKKEDLYRLFERVIKLEKLVDQLYSDRDEDVNKIADQINRHEAMISEMKEGENA